MTQAARKQLKKARRICDIWICIRAALLSQPALQTGMRMHKCATLNGVGVGGLDGRGQTAAPRAMNVWRRTIGIINVCLWSDDMDRQGYEDGWMTPKTMQQYIFDSQSVGWDILLTFVSGEATTCWLLTLSSFVVLSRADTLWARSE
jgi:hypothetical protein